MACDMWFEGRFDYDHHDAARLAVIAFSRCPCAKQSVVLARDLEVRGQTVLVRVDASAPASWWESTCDALRCLSEEARDGFVDATLRSPSDVPPIRVRLLPGGDDQEAALP